MLSLNKYSHFLMDYDGLIVDSEKLYFETWCRVLNEEGQKVCQRFHEGKHESEVYERVRLYLRQDMTLEEISKYRASMFDELVAKGQLELVEGVKGLLGKLQSIAPMSIVSNSVKDIVEDCISSNTLMEDFCKKNYQEYFRSAYDLLLSF